MSTKPINIGVVGVGHLGIHHVKHYAAIPNVNLLGIYDPDIKRSHYVAKKYKTIVFQSLKKLIKNVDALSIVTPTPNHFKTAKLCLKNKKHVFIEKPITVTLEEADKLLELSKNNSTIIQVGHIERLNPALMALEPYDINPKFIEIQRLAPYTVRGTDVPVVLDKMIHDIDILLSLIKSEVSSLEATGMSIITDSLDMAHARIQFKNGSTASLMSSRIAQHDVRKIKLFQKNLYSTIDLLKGTTEIYKIEKNEKYKSDILKSADFQRNGKKRLITYMKPDIKKHDALELELRNFSNSIIGKEKPIVDGKSGRDALSIALDIQTIIKKDFS
ncbi:MAG: Gfo/Idh/MocA family protein [Candidatus Neomarinimicrobiota bacterium]